MIAGQITAGDRKAGVQLSGEFEIAAAGRAVPADIAAVDDEIGAAGVDVFAHPVKIIGQRLMAAGKMGVGNLDQAKFGHAKIPSGPLRGDEDENPPPPGGHLGVAQRPFFKQSKPRLQVLDHGPNSLKQ